MHHLCASPALNRSTLRRLPRQLDRTMADHGPADCARFRLVRGTEVHAAGAEPQVRRHRARSWPTAGRIAAFTISPGQASQSRAMSPSTRWSTGNHRSHKPVAAPRPPPRSAGRWSGSRDRRVSAVVVETPDSPDGLRRASPTGAAASLPAGFASGPFGTVSSRGVCGRCYRQVWRRLAAWSRPGIAPS